MRESPRNIGEPREELRRRKAPGRGAATKYRTSRLPDSTLANAQKSSRTWLGTACAVRWACAICPDATAGAVSMNNSRASDPGHCEPCSLLEPVCP